MAKKRKKKSGGGGFGGSTDSKKSQPQNTRHDFVDPQMLRDKDRFFEIIGSEVDKQNFKSEEEAQAFIQEKFMSRPLDEVLAEYGGYDVSPRGRAQEIVDQGHDKGDRKSVRLAAKEALEIDPNCVNAWMSLAVTESNDAGRLLMNQKAVSVGREEFADLISEAPEDGDFYLWGVHEARPFLMAMAELASLHESRDELEEAVSLYKEILRLNANDNQGVRHDLLNLYLAEGQFSNARELLNKFSEEESCQSFYASAFLDFEDALEEAEQSGWEPGPNEDFPFDSAPKKFFKKATVSLKLAIQNYPWSMAFLLDLRVLETKPRNTIRVGSPEESLEHSQAATATWLLAFAPALWLATEGIRHLDSNAATARIEEFSDSFVSIQQEIKRVKLPEKSINNKEFANIMMMFRPIANKLMDSLV